MPASSKVRWASVSEVDYKLTGIVTKETVPSLELSNISKKLVGRDKIHLDLSEAEKIDTSGLAWLLLLKKKLHQNKTELVLKNAPNTLLKLSALSDATNLLNIE